MEVAAFLPCLGLGQNRGVVAAEMSESRASVSVKQTSAMVVGIDKGQTDQAIVRVVTAPRC